MGILQELLKSEVKPTFDEIAECLSQSDKSVGDEALKRIGNIMGFGQSKTP